MVVIGVPTGAGEKEAEEADSGKCQMLAFSKVLVISCLLGLVELFSVLNVRVFISSTINLLQG